MLCDEDAVRKFGLNRELSDIKLLCRGKTLKPIEQLKNGDVVYVQTAPRSASSPRVSPRYSTPRQPESPMSEKEFLAHLHGEDDRRTPRARSSVSSPASSRASRLSLFHVRSWKSSLASEPSIK